MYAPRTSRPRPLFVSCTTITCCKSQESLLGLLSKAAGEEECSHRRLVLIFVCSTKYVESIISRLPTGHLHLSSPVHAVSSSEGKATLVTATGKRETFDHVIFACHSDDALRILDAGGGATPEEREILGTFGWNRNEIWLHSDKDVSIVSLPSLSLESAREFGRLQGENGS